MGFLQGKRALIVGVASSRSIAWGIAQAMHREGAELAFTYQNEKLQSRVENAASECDSQIVLPCDLANDGQIEGVFAALGKRWDGIDVIVHSAAYAPREELEGDYVASTTRQGFLTAPELSSYRFTALAKAGRLGGATVIYFIVSCGSAVLIGLTMVNLVHPGAGMALQGGVVPERVQGKEDIGVSDILLSMVSPNITAAAANMDVLPLILFAILFAAALTMSGEAGQHVIRFFDGANEALMKIVIWVMYFAPVGIFALVAARLGQAGGEAFLEQLLGAGLYVVTVLSSLTLHFILLTAVLVLVGRRGIDFLVNMLRALFTAFGTASSSATLPLTMECLRENNVDDRAARFVVPLGTTVNMNGTALYEAVAALFIAQAYGIELGTEQQVIVFIT